MKVGMYTTSWNFGERTAEEIASTFDMSQSSMSPDWRPEWDYSAKMNQVHALNPNYKALAYRDVFVIYDYWTDEWNYANSKGWLLRDSAGNYVISSVYPSNYLVDIGNAEYQQWVAQVVKGWIAANPFFDGVMADNSLKYGSYAMQTATNPRTGNLWTNEETWDADAGLINALINALSPKLVLPNGIWNGEAYYQGLYDRTLSQLPNLNAIGSEGIFYQSYGGSWYDEAKWKQSLDMIAEFQDKLLKDHPERRFVGDFPLEGRPTDATLEQFIYFGYCSMLLAAKYTGQNVIGILYPSGSAVDTPEAVATIQLLRNLDVGEPTGDYSVADGVYSRDFTGAKVAVNPTTHIGTIELKHTLPFQDNFADTLKWTKISGVWTP